MQDLVYKKGQAGINKASVTIIFNNQDKEKSPPRYEDDPQITVTRQVLLVFIRLLSAEKTNILLIAKTKARSMLQICFSLFN